MGIGYDERKPWWEKLFNDATKNIKIELHGDEVSLSVNDKDSSPFRSELCEKTVLLKNWHSKQKFVQPESIFTKTCSLAVNQEINAVCSDKTMGHNLILSGKLERIAEQDRILLNKSLSYTTLSENDMAYRKTTVESDMEENEHEVDNNESILQSEKGEDFVIKSKSTKKKHRKRLNKLVEQLGTCNLEDSAERIESLGLTNNNIASNICTTIKVSDTGRIDSNYEKSYKCDIGRRRRKKERGNLEESSVKHLNYSFLNNRKLCQKMKKSKERNMDSNMMLNCLKNGVINKSDLEPFVTMRDDINTNVHSRINLYTRPKLFSEVKKRIIGQFNTIPQIKCGNDKDSIWHKIVLSPDLKSIIEENRVTDKRYKEWVVVDVEEEKRQKDVYNCIVPICSSKQSVSKNTKSFSKRDILSHIDEELREHYTRKLNNKIQKKKEQRYRSRQRDIKKVVDKLKGEALAHELNSVIKNLTAFDLTEEINTKTIKKRPTQTHLTPV